VRVFAEVADKCRRLDCPSSATRRLIGTARSLLLSFTRPLSPPYDNRRAAPPLDRSHTTKTPLDDAVSTPPPPATQTIRPPRHAYVPGRAIGAQRDEASGRGEKEHKSRDEPPARRLRPPAPHLSPPPPAALGRSPNARPIGPWGTCPARSSRLAATRVVLATAPVPRRSRSLLASQATARFSSTFHIVRCRRTSRARSLDFCANYQSSASIPRPSSCLLPRSELSPFVVIRCHSLPFVVLCCRPALLPRNPRLLLLSRCHHGALCTACSSGFSSSPASFRSRSRAVDFTSPPTQHQQHHCRWSSHGALSHSRRSSTR